MKFLAFAKKFTVAAAVFAAVSAQNLSANDDFFSSFGKAKSTQSKGLNTIFGSGTVLPGSRAGAKSRWYLFNELNLGYSYSMLGDLRLHSVDAGLSAYILSIDNADGFRPFVGAEVSAPIYLRAGGKGNSFDDPLTGFNGRGNAVVATTEYQGFGIQPALVVGLQRRAFYMQAMAGYGYHQIAERYFVNDAVPDQTLDNTYQGIVYGVGIGGRMSNVFQIGLRFVMGDLENTERKFKEDTAETQATALRVKNFKERYYRASVVVGYMF